LEDLGSFAVKIEYSPAAEIALTKAATLAHQSGRAQIGPMDLLHALMSEDEGQPVTLALAAGADMEKLRNLFPAGAAVAEELADLPLAAASAAVLANARELARLHAAEGSISSDYLFLAILDSDTSARALLEGVGLDFAALQARICPTAEPLRLDEPLDMAPRPDAMDVARILDASANRAREALRVVEDFARFSRGDAFLSAQLKGLRHRLAEALQELPAGLLLRARDTLHDVGTAISTAQEHERTSSSAVVKANVKRLQEALRSLEEFGKVLSPAFAVAIEQMRYESYTLERLLMPESDRGAQLAAARLYVIVSEASCRASLVGTVSEALAGGAQVIQLREKSMADRVLLETARDIRKMTRSAGALFIVNDRADIALLADADGVHLGQDDMAVHDARRLLGPEALIGVSTHNLEQVHQAVLGGASYIGVGPTFASSTKQFTEFPGLDFVRQASAETALPAFVLGGVRPANLGEVLAAGGSRVAVSHAVCSAEDPRAVTRTLRMSLERKTDRPD
jgi:thiamine-phosphate pyrophosphorylase